MIKMKEVKMTVLMSDVIRKKIYDYIELEIPLKNGWEPETTIDKFRSRCIKGKIVGNKFLLKLRRKIREEDE